MLGYVVPSPCPKYRKNQVNWWHMYFCNCGRSPWSSESGQVSDANNGAVKRAASLDQDFGYHDPRTAGSNEMAANA